MEKDEEGVDSQVNFLKAFCCYNIYPMLCLVFFNASEYFSEGEGALEDHMIWSGLIVSGLSIVTFLFWGSIQACRNQRGMNLSPIRNMCQTTAICDFITRSYCFGLVITISNRTYVIPDFIQSFFIGAIVIALIEDVIFKWIEDNCRKQRKQTLPCEIELKMLFIIKFVSTLAATVFFASVKLNTQIFGKYKLNIENFTSMFSTDSSWGTVAKMLVVMPLIFLLVRNLTDHSIRALPVGQKNLWGVGFTARKVGSRLDTTVTFAELQFEHWTHLLQMTVVLTILTTLFFMGIAVGAVGIGRLFALIVPGIDDFYGVIIGLACLNVANLVNSATKACLKKAN